MGCRTPWLEDYNPKRNIQAPVQKRRVTEKAIRRGFLSKQAKKLWAAIQSPEPEQAVEKLTGFLGLCNIINVMTGNNDLTTIPNVGKATAADLNRIGINSVEDLKGADALQLFEQLCLLDGFKHDPCTLDVFLSAVDYATNGVSKPWWKYTNLRKTIYK